MRVCAQLGTSSIRRSGSWPCKEQNGCARGFNAPALVNFFPCLATRGYFFAFPSLLVILARVAVVGNKKLIAARTDLSCFVASVDPAFPSLDPPIGLKSAAISVLDKVVVCFRCRAA